MPICKNVNELYAPMQPLVRKFIQKCKDSGVNVAIVETYRTANVQRAYYAQGREPLEEVNKKRNYAGLWNLPPRENARVITNCDGVNTLSRHQSRRAVDIAPVKDCRIDWNAPQETWERMGALAEECGLDWCAGGFGAVWGKGWDNPHFEYKEEK